MTSIDLPKSTRTRLIQLLQILKNWQTEKITSVAISEATGWKSSLIRHDLWLIGFNKGVSNGYIAAELEAAIKKAVGIPEKSTDNLLNETQNKAKNNCCIIGLGRLGAALLDEAFVEGSPFVIKAGFDSNVNRVEILRSTFPLYPASEMQWIIRQEKIQYAILTVLNKDAQQMTDRLVKAGIKGIVNMTNVVLRVPEGVKVENLSILNALNLVL